MKCDDYLIRLTLATLVVVTCLRVDAQTTSAQIVGSPVPCQDPCSRMSTGETIPHSPAPLHQHHPLGSFPASSPMQGYAQQLLQTVPVPIWPPAIAYPHFHFRPATLFHHSVPLQPGFNSGIPPASAPAIAAPYHLCCPDANPQFMPITVSPPRDESQNQWNDLPIHPTPQQSAITWDSQTDPPASIGMIPAESVIDEPLVDFLETAPQVPPTQVPPAQAPLELAESGELPVEESTEIEELLKRVAECEALQNRIETLEQELSETTTQADRSRQLEKELESAKVELAEAKQILGILRQELEMTRVETEKLEEMAAELEKQKERQAELKESLAKQEQANKELAKKLSQSDKQAAEMSESTENQPKSTESIDPLQEKISIIQEKMKILEEATATKLERAEKRIRNRMGRQRQKLIDEGADENDKKVQDIDRKMKLELNNSARRIKAEGETKKEQLKQELEQLRDSKQMSFIGNL